MKRLKLGLLLSVLLIGSFFFNICIHECGHYAAAKVYDLNPQVHFDAYDPDTGKLTLYSPMAYTTYGSNNIEVTNQDALIAFAGPAVNLIFALLILGAYISIPKTKKYFWARACLIAIFIPAIVSFAVNMIPIGAADGAVIFSALG